MKDKFGQFKIDFPEHPEKKEKPWFTKEQLDDLYTDEEGETEQDQLEYAYWIKKFGNKRLLETKDNNLETEKEKALNKIKQILGDMKKEVRLRLIKESGLNTFSDNQNYFSDFDKVAKIANRLKVERNPLGYRLLSDIGSYRVLKTIEKRIEEGDYKKMAKYFSDLEKKGTLSSLEITKSSCYLFIKEILNQVKEESLA